MTLDRPEALNALSFDLLDELATALESLDADPACRAIVITGAGDRAFAAGADIRELAAQTPTSLAADGRFGAWDRIAAIGLPLIAAVRGFALGGGCELAMACDMIVAAEDATFGQPEIRLGVMPGAGGTQRLTRAIGKARAMELILTGRTMTAQEADAHGLITRIVPAEATVDAALELAGRIAAMPPLAVRAAKAAILDAAERSLSDGLVASARPSSDSSTPRTRPRGWPPSPRNARPSGRDADRERATGGRHGARPRGRDRRRTRLRARPRRRAAGGDPRHRARLPRADRRVLPGQRPLPGARTDDLGRRRAPNRTGRAPGICSIRRSARSGRRAWRSTRSIESRWPRTARRAMPSRSSMSDRPSCRSSTRSTPVPTTSSSTATTCCRGASSRPRSRMRRCATSRPGRRPRRGPTRSRATGGSSARTPGTAGTPPGSSCRRSSRTSSRSSARSGGSSSGSRSAT